MSKKVPDNERYKMVVEWMSKKGKKKQKVFKDSETNKSVMEFQRHKGASLSRVDKYPNSSIPENPVLGKGRVWDKKNLDAVRGRVVEIGWLDQEPMRVFVISAELKGDRNWGSVNYYDPLSEEYNGIDSPDQVIKIGCKIIDSLQQTGFYSQIQKEI